MATNDFIGFASAGSANVMSQADYAAAAEQADGVQPGMASSKLANKAWRQGANMAAAIANIITAQGLDALDNGDIAALASNILAALSSMYLPLAGGTMTGNIIFNSAFIIQAGNSGGYKQLIGNPNGTLTWDSLPLVCGEFYTDHCKLNNKIEMEIGYVEAAVGGNTVTFKRAFPTGATPKVFVQPWANNAAANANVYSLSTTGFSLNSSQAGGVLYFAISLVG